MDFKQSMVTLAAAVAENVPTDSLRFSNSASELRNNLEERGIEVQDTVKCECGHEIPFEEVVAVSKDHEGVHYFCKDCMR